MLRNREGRDMWKIIHYFIWITSNSVLFSRVDFVGSSRTRLTTRFVSPTSFPMILTGSSLIAVLGSFYLKVLAILFCVTPPRQKALFSPQLRSSFLTPFLRFIFFCSPGDNTTSVYVVIHIDHSLHDNLFKRLTRCQWNVWRDYRGDYDLCEFLHIRVSSLITSGVPS